MKRSIFLLFFIVCLTFSHSFLFGQKTYHNLEWVSNSPVTGDSIFKTASIEYGGKLYVTGNTLNTNGDADIVTVKFNSNGDTVWTSTYSGNAGEDDYGIDIAVLSNGDVITLGASKDSLEDYNYVLIRYANSNGDEEWSYEWNGQGEGVDIPYDLVIDPYDKIYAVGGSEASNGLSDYGVIKLSSSGSFSWESYYDYNDLHDAAATAAIDKTKTYLVVTGGSAANVGDYDIATAKIKLVDGSYSSPSRTSQSNTTLAEVFGMTNDTMNNFYITGYAVVSGEQNIQTIKLDSNLTVDWVVNYNGGLNDVGRDIAVDNSGNVYVTGYTQLTNGSNNNITIKYDSQGNLQWKREFGNIVDPEDVRGEKIEIDANNNIYVVGNTEENNTVKIDLLRYTPTGQLKMYRRIESDTINYRAHNMAVAGENIYVSGLSHSTPTETFTVAKFSVFDKNQPIHYCSGEPCAVDDEALVRFRPQDLILSKVDDKDKSWGYVKDFVNSTAITYISGKVGFDIGDQRCYKMFPKSVSTDTIAYSRSGNIVDLPPFYASFGVILPSGSNDTTVITKLNQCVPHILVAQRNGFAKLGVYSNDPYYTDSSSAGLYPTSSYPNANINVEGAWDYEDGDSSIIVGVYDSGINYAHNDMSLGSWSTSSVKDGYDYYNNVPINSTADPDNVGHGSAVAGIIGARRNNSFGIAGIAGGDNNERGVTIHDMKMFEMDLPGIPPYCYINSVALGDIPDIIKDGSQGLVMPQQDIMNHSWRTTSAPDFFMREAFRTAYSLEIVSVVMSGNDHAWGVGLCDNFSYPATYADRFIMKVGANDTTGGRAEFSDCGHNLDFIAPGVNDLYIGMGHEGSNFSDTAKWIAVDTCTSELNGTSFAAPHAVGLVALMLSYYENFINIPSNNLETLTPEDCEELMQRNTFDVDTAGYDDETGYGRINAGQVMDSLQFPMFRIDHVVQSISTSGATLVGSAENFCLEESTYGLTVGNQKANRFEVTANFAHSLQPGYSLITGWPLGSKSNIYGINSSTDTSSCPITLFTCQECNYMPDAPNPQMHMTSLTSTGVTMTGYIYELLDSLNNPVGWLPFDTTYFAKFAYSLYSYNSGVGIEEESEIGFKIYPNPTNSTVTVALDNSISEDGTITLYDHLGKMIKQFKVGSLMKNETISFDVSHLAQGIYFVTLRTDGNQLSRKLIVSQ
ncbi:S8 family serine peptidase [Paracrocinitomix mangrovi]|uniref:S8/S53 family peptidase n=1 Tax=Paracrocinitomix mangrovi TaxID=2862509 RepID=UPI001C8E3023|nr:S8/S53 family peptidase [Paracrocinitomix mangrovi]UKN02243.1 S8 family serine peptidase [Paracrocinitomix mangrovi]